MSNFTLVPPAHHLSPERFGTFGPEVVDLGAEAGLIADPEQALILDDTFAYDRHGKSVAFDVCVVCARQNLKTGVFKLCALGWLFVRPQRLVMWSAHKFSTAQEAHRDLVELIDGSPSLRKHLKRVVSGGLETSIELKSGVRIIFKARTRSGSRGLSGNKVVLDEAFALDPFQMAALVPTLSAMPDPQLLYGSSAGLMDSEVLRGVRDRGRSGTGYRLAYIEWCAQHGLCEADHCSHALNTPGCALDRVENWYDANPLLGRRRKNGTGLTLEYIRSERETFAKIPLEFARERLGWWDEPGADAVFGPGKWTACARPTPALRVRIEALAVEVDAELAHASIVGAANIGGLSYVQPLQHGLGTDWVPAALARLGDPRTKILVDGSGPAAELIPHILAYRDPATGRTPNKRRIKELVSSDNFDAYAAFYKAVLGGVIWHDNDPLLRRSLDGAVPRNVNDRITWGRRQSTSDITTIVAATLGAWWVGLPSRGTHAPAAQPQVVSAPAAAPRDSVMSAGF